VGLRTNKPMSRETLPGAADRAVEILGCIIEGRWADARRDFGAAILEAVDADRIARAWAVTAAELALVGRTAVEQAAVASGMADPGLDVPFLTTRELFALKLIGWPRLADSYLARNAAGRLAMLTSTIDRVPCSTLTAAGSAAWTAPRWQPPCRSTTGG
jgi:hypothetical protein